MARLVIELNCDCDASGTALLFAQVAVAANTPVLASDSRGRRVRLPAEAHLQFVLPRGGNGANWCLLRHVQVSAEIA